MFGAAVSRTAQRRNIDNMDVLLPCALGPDPCQRMCTYNAPLDKLYLVYTPPCSRRPQTTQTQNIRETNYSNQALPTALRRAAKSSIRRHWTDRLAVPMKSAWMILVLPSKAESSACSSTMRSGFTDENKETRDNIIKRHSTDSIIWDESFSSRILRSQMSGTSMSMPHLTLRNTFGPKIYQDVELYINILGFAMICSPGLRRAIYAEPFKDHGNAVQFYHKRRSVLAAVQRTAHTHLTRRASFAQMHTTIYMTLTSPNSRRQKITSPARLRFPQHLLGAQLRPRE